MGLLPDWCYYTPVIGSKPMLDPSSQFCHNPECHASGVDVQHIQADELYVKMVGKRVRMAIAVPFRLWLGGGEKPSLRPRPDYLPGRESPLPRPQPGHPGMRRWGCQLRQRLPECSASQCGQGIWVGRSWCWRTGCCFGVGDQAVCQTADGERDPQGGAGD